MHLGVVAAVVALEGRSGRRFWKLRFIETIVVIGPPVSRLSQIMLNILNIHVPFPLGNVDVFFMPEYAIYLYLYLRSCFHVTALLATSLDSSRLSSIYDAVSPEEIRVGTRQQ